MCEHAKQVLDTVGRDYPLTVEQVPLDTARGRALATEHAVLFAPGILLDGRCFGYGRLSERQAAQGAHLPRPVTPLPLRAG